MRRWRWPFSRSHRDASPHATERSPGDGRGVVAPSDRRFFFVHVMKTGGTTLHYQARQYFRPGEVFPSVRNDRESMEAAYSSLAYLRELPDERIREIRCYFGHFPLYVAPELEARIGEPLVVMTLLRDPVERAISLLKHAREFNPQTGSMSVEEIYDEPRYNRMFIRDFQVRSFATDPGDGHDTIFHYVEVDDVRLDLAKRRLDTLDLIGFHEHYEEFLRGIADRYGWRFDDIPSQRVSEPEMVSDSLRRRIEEDNRADVEFYEYALKRYGGVAR